MPSASASTDPKTRDLPSSQPISAVSPADSTFTHIDTAAAKMSEFRATVAILSIGDMGVGIARLLRAHDYRVITNVSDRSNSTQQRAKANDVENVLTDIDLYSQADYILSIVPQKDARSVAERVVATAQDERSADGTKPIYFIDLNAVKPKTARATATLLAEHAPAVKFIDGGIIGGPPKPTPDGSWFRPKLVVSGPLRLDQAEKSGAHLAETLNLKHIDEEIGSASALKMCFASLSKGFAAIAIESVTTANRFGLTGELTGLLNEFSPALAGLVTRLVPSVPPKAYRWVQEMHEIADTFEDEGLFPPDESIFRPISNLYKFIAHETPLGQEQTEDRKLGKTVDDLANVIALTRQTTPCHHFESG